MAESRSYSDKTIKMVYGRAGACCSKCKTNVIREDEINKVIGQIGKMAHIYPFGNDPKAPRYADIVLDGFDLSKKNEYENIILLCSSCHDEADLLSLKHTAKELIKMKQDHEKWVSDRLEQKVADVSSAELSIICDALANTHDISPLNPDYELPKIQEKIEKNKLSDRNKNLIQIGLLRADTVHNYLNSQINAFFAEKLLSNVKGIYADLTKSFSGDELFSEFLIKINAGFDKDLAKQAAGIAVISYFFHICEIFEK